MLFRNRFAIEIREKKSFNNKFVILRNYNFSLLMLCSVYAKRWFISNRMSYPKKLIIFLQSSLYVYIIACVDVYETKKIIYLEIF